MHFSAHNRKVQSNQLNKPGTDGGASIFGLIIEVFQLNVWYILVKCVCFVHWYICRFLLWYLLEPNDICIALHIWFGCVPWSIVVRCELLMWYLRAICIWFEDWFLLGLSFLSGKNGINTAVIYGVRAIRIWFNNGRVHLQSWIQKSTLRHASTCAYRLY